MGEEIEFFLRVHSPPTAAGRVPFFRPFAGGGEGFISPIRAGSGQVVRKSLSSGSQRVTFWPVPMPCRLRT